MKDGFMTIKDLVEVRINIDNSLFIANGSEIRSIDDAKKYLESIKGKYPDATHNCSAYLLNHEYGFDDDKEPGGTAGIPILNVIKKHGVHYLIIVVTRYFGGRKLGIRGLIDAYGKAAEILLESGAKIFRQQGVVYHISTDYRIAEQLINRKLHKELQVLEKSFTDKVIIKIFIPSQHIGMYEGFFSENHVKVLSKYEFIL